MEIIRGKNIQDYGGGIPQIHLRSLSHLEEYQSSKK